MFVGDMTKEMSEKVKYEGPPTGRRALMFAFLAAMTPGQQKAPPPTTKEEPAKPTPTKEPAKPKAKPKK
jgi:hypothetical protein